jgi:hypothetical protein
MLLKPEPQRLSLGTHQNIERVFRFREFIEELGKSTRERKALSYGKSFRRTSFYSQH